jgi:hypothetical protein
MLPYKAKGRCVYSGSRDSTGRWELVSEDRMMVTTVSKSRVPVVFSVTFQERPACQDLMAATLSHVQYCCSEVAEGLVGWWAEENGYVKQATRERR